MAIDKDDPDPNMPWASRLDVAELIELARRKRREHGIAYPHRPDGWMGPAPPEAKDLKRPCCTMSDGGFSHAGDGTVPSRIGERLLWFFTESDLHLAA